MFFFPLSVQEVTDDAGIELSYKDICSETTRLQELSDENAKLRMELHELKNASEIDGKGKTNKPTKQVNKIIKSINKEGLVHLFFLFRLLRLIWRLLET